MISNKQTSKNHSKALAVVFITTEISMIAKKESDD